METKKFPEAWSIRGSEEFKIFLETSKIRKGNIGGDSRLGWYNYDGILVDYDYEEQNSGNPLFEVVTIEQLNEHYLNVPIKEKKIISYKLKEGCEKYKKAITAITSFEHWQFSPISISKQALERAEVLDLWFEPVYKKELKEIILEIGSPVKRVKITSKGKIVTDDEVQYTYSINYVEEILKGFTDLYNAHVSKIWIGCSEGTEVSKEEVEKVINTYKQLNP